MRAAKFNRVSILCFLTQEQIESVVNHVWNKLPNNPEDVSDIDEPMFNGTVRVCAYFERDIRGQLQIKTAEILDSDWELLEGDSFAFSQRLNIRLTEYNNQHQELYRQAMDSLHDRLAHTSC